MSSNSVYLSYWIIWFSLMLYQDPHIIQSLCGTPHAPSDSPAPLLSKMEKWHGWRPALSSIWNQNVSSSYMITRIYVICSLQYISLLQHVPYTVHVLVVSQKINSNNFYGFNLYPVLSSLRSHWDLVVTISNSPFVSTCRCTTIPTVGFNPSEKYARQIRSSPLR